MSTLPPQRRLRESLLWSAVVIAPFSPLSFSGRLQVGCGWSCMRVCIDDAPLPAAEAKLVPISKYIG